jgi:hypothetical protein
MARRRATNNRERLTIVTKREPGRCSELDVNVFDVVVGLLDNLFVLSSDCGEVWLACETSDGFVDAWTLALRPLVAQQQPFFVSRNSFQPLFQRTQDHHLHNQQE